MTHNEYDIDYDIAIPIIESFADLKPKGFWSFLLYNNFIINSNLYQFFINLIE